MIRHTVLLLLVRAREKANAEEAFSMTSPLTAVSVSLSDVPLGHPQCLCAAVMRMSQVCQFALSVFCPRRELHPCHPVSLPRDSLEEERTWAEWAAGPHWLEQAPCGALPCVVQDCVALLIGVPAYGLPVGTPWNLELGDRIEKVVVAFLCSLLCGEGSELCRLCFIKGHPCGGC